MQNRLQLDVTMKVLLLGVLCDKELLHNICYMGAIPEIQGHCQNGRSYGLRWGLQWYHCNPTLSP